MNIPDEAMEAAGDALIYHQRRDITACFCGWSELGRSHAAHQARIALEAAAQPLMVAAWDEGLAMGRGAARGEPEEPNPYRIAEAGE